jgi:imidazolonepropionase-like amidohydrolase
MQRILTLLVVLLFSIPVFSQETFPVNGTADPRHTIYAFKNAVLHVDYKTSVSGATLLIQDGKILNSGAGITIPANAVVFDLNGKHIYPALIDIFSDYGMTEVKRVTDFDRTPQFISNTKGAYNWNQSVRAEYDAHRTFTTDAKKAEELRKLGFGAVMSVLRDGIVRGTSTFVLLGDERENEMIIRDRAGSNFSFHKGTSTQDYPSSLMGAIALIRQTYLDAEWYSAGGYKEEYNISLDAFNKNKNLPQIFEVSDKQNALRAERIGTEFGVDYIIKGGGDEYERIEEIKNTGNAFIVPLNFPEGYDFSDPYEALNVSLRQMKVWELAPTNAAVLASNKIPFALTLSDLKNKADFWKNLRKAIDNGLSEEDAIKALTYSPAQLLKLDDQIGSLKNNMRANFIITSTNLTNKDNQIFENWINGKRYQIIDPAMKDVRGNYSLSIGNIKPLRIKIGGEVNTPEVFVFEDTTSTKISMSRQGQTVTMQVELKKTEPKGSYRLTGETSGAIWSGNVLLPTADWGKWSMKFDSAFTAPSAKKDSAKKDSIKGPVYLPNMAYGWKQLPQAKTYLIRNATVWTNEQDGILKNTDVLIENGKIKQVGKNIAAPAGCEITDGTNLHVTPRNY